tara:strand:- start:524 stop:829 length:306 start_codon:yes stop_codon:yes gene_type:complete
MNLTNRDYVTILNYYNKTISNNKQKNKSSAENILASKLCRCIKKLNRQTFESKAIGICTNSIFKKHNLKYHKFTCKKSYKLKAKKNTKKKIFKTGKLDKYK